MPSQDPYKIKDEKIKALEEEKKKIDEIKASQKKIQKFHPFQ